MHIVENLIPNVIDLDFVLVENVKGFEGSQAHDMLVRSLQKTGFKYQEFLICPRQLGIPNSRLRYYLIASKLGKFPQGESIKTDLSNEDSEIVELFQETRPLIESFIDNENDPFDKLLVNDVMLEKHAEVFDIVQAQSTSSCCFTKAYGKYAQGTGSILQQRGDLKDAFQKAGTTKAKDRLAALKGLELRFFTPFEVAKLMGFPAPSRFQFPKDYIQRPHLCYRVLGNSLNVSVVSMLTTLLIKGSLP